MAFGIAESEFPNPSIQCDVYIFQLICMDRLLLQIMVPSLWPSMVNLKATQCLDFIHQFKVA